MNREILFRGKKSNGRWVYGSLVVSENISPAIYYNVSKGVADVLDWCYVKPDTIGQYTGLTDKEGNKIFEGDVLYQGAKMLGVVCISARYGISIQKKSSTWSLINFVLDSDFDAGVLSDIEVRGNIYDNSELMK